MHPRLKDFTRATTDYRVPMCLATKLLRMSGDKGENWSNLPVELTIIYLVSRKLSK
jgi:hypothetical protein